MGLRLKPPGTPRNSPDAGTVRPQNPPPIPRRARPRWVPPTTPRRDGATLPLPLTVTPALLSSLLLPAEEFTELLAVEAPRGSKRCMKNSFAIVVSTEVCAQPVYTRLNHYLFQRKPLAPQVSARNPVTQKKMGQKKSRALPATRNVVMDRTRPKNHRT